MDFVSIRIITDQIKPLMAFYETITGLSATWFTDDFAELATPSCTLAIGSTRTLALFGTDVAQPAANRSAIIEFRVSDVDAEYSRLVKIIGGFVQTPTTMPWGNRSLLLRDPDGNLVNFFTPVSAEAIRKFDRKAGAVAPADATA
ncbi:VOC family protein [Mesorhizobium caraganae]|uniref:VOC family protein n=1 Tax=Mesorhizobium caraganae TaxID=483206 RepID=A0ABV1Z2T4_9HYPH